MIAVAATVNAATRKDIIQKLDMDGCTFIYASPDRPNILCYSVKLRTNITTDLTHVLDDLKTNSIKAMRVIIYCKSLNMCGDLYAHFLCELGGMSKVQRRLQVAVSLVCTILVPHHTIRRLFLKAWQLWMEQHE